MTIIQNLICCYLKNKFLLHFLQYKNIYKGNFSDIILFKPNIFSYLCNAWNTFFFNLTLCLVILFIVLYFTCSTEIHSFPESQSDDPSSASLLCVQCKDAFQNAWDLMVHAQAAHMLNIYELGVPTIINCSSPSPVPNENSSDKASNTHLTYDLCNIIIAVLVLN